ncbi:PAR1 protein [Euphorbia peplus]|nr:PAR1 protein [Euphorbia peplus]
MAFIIFLALSLLLHGALGTEIICEELPIEVCSYAISSSGKRCLLENNYEIGKNLKECKTSEVIVDKLQGFIESEECVNACGVDRNTIGISSDSLLQPHFLSKLCSNTCYQSCPNIVDLYFNLALAEGVYLPDMCANPRRALSEAKSSSDAAPSPVADYGDVAPSPVSEEVVYLESADSAPVYDEVKPACSPSSN